MRDRDLAGVTPGPPGSRLSLASRTHPWGLLAEAGQGEGRGSSLREVAWDRGSLVLVREPSSPPSYLPVLSLQSLTFPCSPVPSCQPPILSGHGQLGKQQPPGSRLDDEA